MSQPRRFAAVFAACRLSTADFLHEWRLSVCLILGLAAVLAPLLVLFGLKSGIVEGMRQRLMSDPHTLEVLVIGNYSLKQDWFTALKADPLVSFAIARTRSLSATVDLQGPPSRDSKSLVGVEMVPSGSGDPLLGGLAAPQNTTDILISHSAALKLAVQQGDSITAFVRRSLGGQTQVQRLPLTVTAVLPESAFGRDGVFVSLPFLAASEDYRDGRDGTDGRAAAPPLDQRAFASARIFAASLDSVAPLAERLRQDGLEIRTKANEIATLTAIDSSLTLIFTLIAGLAGGGYALSLTVSLWAHVDRKRKDLALLRLVGFSPLAVHAFPLVQGILIALFGSALSVTLSLAVAAIINVSLASSMGGEDFVCLLRFGDLLTASAATVALAIVASSIGGSRAARIDPAESLREV
jgi:putative ABC transport system permease protein